MSKTTITLGAILLSDIAGAHPQHTSGGYSGLLHYLTDPFHVGLVAVAVLVGLVGLRSMLRRRSVRHTG